MTETASTMNSKAHVGTAEDRPSGDNSSLDKMNEATTFDAQNRDVRVMLEQETTEDDTSGEEAEEAEAENEEGRKRSTLYLERLAKFWQAYHFPCLILLAIMLARVYPPLGSTYLQPQITATWIAVMIIFLISGLGLRTEEFTKAFQRFYFNCFVQIYNFGLVSTVVFGFGNALKEIGAINDALADGMIICSSLPMAINVVIVLTVAAGGDEAAAIFNSTFGNLLGIFLSPALILLYLDTSGNVTLATVFYKLTIRVIIPLVVGQVLRKCSEPVSRIVTARKRVFKRIQEYCLVFIVYTVFCTTFENGFDVGLKDVVLMIVFQSILLTFFMLCAWFSLKFLDFDKDPRLRVMGLFGCCGKTIALGVPLIDSIYENDPQRGLYTLPLLVWHPLQLIVGSYLAPRLAAFIRNEEERLSCDTSSDTNNSVTNSTPGPDRQNDDNDDDDIEGGAMTA